MRFYTPDATSGTTPGALLPLIHARGQGFGECLDDGAVHRDITAYAESVRGQFDHIVLLGIGGSALGPRVLRDALVSFENEAKHTPALHIVDNIDPVLIRQVERNIDLTRTLFLVVTKSGGTPETLALYSHFSHLLSQASLPVKRHMVAITDPESGFLRQEVGRLGLTSFPIPPNVGGRFSVLTAVGLLPAALLGIEIEKLLEGARAQRDAFMTEEEQENPSFQLAAFLHQQASEGRLQTVMMPYSQQLSTFGEWWAQLLAESTGKIDARGNAVGLTPITALGVTDQHSQLQLYAQGPDDKHYLFMGLEEMGEDVSIPDMYEHPKTSFLQGVSFGELLKAEYTATKQTLRELGRPMGEFVLARVDAYTLGELFFVCEGATAFLGEMLEINAFDQPGVERSKILTREALAD